MEQAYTVQAPMRKPKSESMKQMQMQYRVRIVALGRKISNLVNPGCSSSVKTY